MLEVWSKPILSFLPIWMLMRLLLIVLPVKMHLNLVVEQPNCILTSINATFTPFCIFYDIMYVKIKSGFACHEIPVARKLRYPD